MLFKSKLGYRQASVQEISSESIHCEQWSGFEEGTCWGGPIDMLTVHKMWLAREI